MTDSKVIQIPEIEAIEDEARLWIVRFEDGDASGEELAAFEAWRAQSSAHRDTFDRLSGFWSDADGIGTLVDYGESEAAIDAVRHDRFTQTSRKVWRAAAGVMAACFAIFVGLAVHSYTVGENRSLTAAFQTVVGEQKVIDLPDGSSVTLNTGSALEIEYGWRQRRIRLKNGEAYFEVASNKRRPFLVETDSGVVRAVGTAFSVRVNAATLDVVVTEGRVSVAPIEIPTIELPEAVTVAARRAAVEVSARQMLSLTPQTARVGVEEVSKREMEKELDWRDGELAFEGETLEAIVAKVSRYTDVSIEIEGDELRAQRIVAYYEIGDIDPLLDALHVITGAEVIYVDERTVRLRREESRKL